MRIVAPIPFFVAFFAVQKTVEAGVEGVVGGGQGRFFKIQTETDLFSIIASFTLCSYRSKEFAAVAAISNYGSLLLRISECLCMKANPAGQAD